MIGIFDSGLGGLTVVKEIFKILPEYQIVYFGDTARVPYGTKSDRVIKQYALEDADFLIKQGAKIIIIACHTVSAVAGSLLRKKFPQIPIFDVVESGLKRAVNISKNKVIGVIGTPATIKSRLHERMLKKIDSKIQVINQACPLLVPLVEEGWIKRPETRRIVRYYLRPLIQKRIDVLILACTHYPLLKKVIDDILRKKVFVVDPAEEVAKEVKKFIENNLRIKKILNPAQKGHKFFVSDKPYHYEKFSQRILGRGVKIELVNFRGDKRRQIGVD